MKDEMPTQKQIDAGNKISEELIDASIEKSLSGSKLGGTKEYNKENFKYSDIVDRYVNNEIDSITAIWIAMKRAE
jgi:hypothetical protein